MDNPESGEPRRGLPTYLRVLGLLAVGFAVGRTTAPTPPPIVIKAADGAAPAGTTETPAEPERELTEDEQFAADLVGVWTTQSHGTQVCTLHADGTGSVHADLDWAARLLYGKQLDMNIQWRIEDGHLIQTLLGGTPEDMVQKLINDYGEVKSYRIDSLTETTGVLVDTSDGEKIVWTSVD